MIKGAIISDCKKYRYSLWRTWDETKPKVLFIMLNPSTADENIDDPTIRRCISFAKDWGYGSLVVGNLFALRATDPKELLNSEDPMGCDNIVYLNKMYDECDLIVCAWGNSGIVNKICKKFKEYEPLTNAPVDLSYIDLAKDGTPKHPLYLKKELKPKKFYEKR